MLQEVLEALRPKPGGRYADGTLGGAGHAYAILEASAPTGWLYGCDRDGAALEAAQQRLAVFSGRYDLRQGTFEELPHWVSEASCDGVLLDLGVSSPQLDWPERGFSFQQEGPLDMRMDRRQPRTAADVVNQASVGELAEIFSRLGGEKKAMAIARAIERQRQMLPFSTTRELAELVERVSPRHGARTHPATRVFQALRIVVNEELAILERGLEAVWKLLKPGGRLAVITFHSLEDQRVKHFARERARDYTVPGGVDIPELRRPRQPDLQFVQRKAILPGESELKENPRARSAQLRVFERI